MKNGFFAILLFLVSTLNVYAESNSSSVLASGEWYKIYTKRDGVYRITWSELRGLGLTDPANVRIYGWGGTMLPETADKNYDADLEEIPIRMVSKTAGVFADGDYILFYGQGPAVWKYDEGTQTFTHSVHLWDNQACYFITSKAGGKRIVTETVPQQPAKQTVTTFDEHLYHEWEHTSMIRSGRQWYGEQFWSDSLSRNFSFSVPDIDMSMPALLDVAFVARSSFTSYLKVEYDGQQIANQILPSASGQQTAAAVSFSTPPFNVAYDQVAVKLTLNQNGNTNAQGWLDYLRLHVRRKLNMAQPQLFFRDSHSVGEGQIAAFQISGSNVNTQIWDITDMHQIKQMDVSLASDVLSFTATTDHLREFVAFDLSTGLLSPIFPDKDQHVDNQDLHAMNQLDMVIVSYPGFTDAAQQLAALHREREGLAVEVVTTAQVYNEFSSGKQDPAAIRNFMKMLYEKTPASRLKYLLLMGDGSFDNRSIMVNSGRTTVNTNYVVTYQSDESLHTTQSYVSDDYFGVLDDGDAIKGGRLRIGVGRLPVQATEDAQAAVDKIRRYMDGQFQGNWPNLMGLLADDEDLNIHTSQSDSLAIYVNDYHPQYAIDKLYFDAFPQVVTADGHRYPEVAQRLDDLLNRGCLLVNYVGHGNETGLSEERVVNTTSISKWSNKIYPLFVVATCEFGRYDEYSKTSAGEMLVLKPDGGGIALLTSTRLVYSSQNFDFNKRFFRALFTRLPGEGQYRLGDVVKIAKNNSAASVNKLCFTLLGDPALQIPVPVNDVRTVFINGKPVSEPLDTLKANSKVTIKAQVTDKMGQVLTGFNGVVYISLFDKPREVATLDNDGNSKPMKFETQTSVLYKGKAQVRNGEFEQTFIMPRDINYQYGFGKITYYACSDDDAASGAFAGVTVGGTEPAIDDQTGPEIKLFINDTFFRDGGITDQNPLLIAHLSDENGINTAGEGIGHDITAVLSNDPSTIYYLNSYYEAELDDYRKGTVAYRFSNLPVGDYELTFTAWDVVNNPSQASIRFRVTTSGVLQISNLYNYPNPFSDCTNIYFEYNMPDVTIDVEVQIFDMSGRQLRSIKQSIRSDGYTSGIFQWDGSDANGNRMNAGMYPYRVILRNPTGQVVKETSKMLLLR